MSFSADWLALREPFDHAARSDALAGSLAASLAAVPTPWRVLELGAGTGSGARWLTDRLGTPLSMWALDHDAALLDRIPADLATPRHADVRDFGAWPEALHAVTLQALLDLVDLGFLQQLADALTARRLPVLAALTVDGRVAWDPVHPDDDAVQAAFRLHQLGDRGFGASVGSFAAPIFADLLRVRGFEVDVRTADWRIDGTSAAMLSAMIDGTAEAAREGTDPARVAAWAAHRHAQVAASTLTLRVGHLDVLGLPAPG